MKKIISVTAAAALLISGYTISASAAVEKDDDIVILYTNDVHCSVDSMVGYDGLALYKREMEATHKNVALVDAGDAIQGGTMGTLSDGAYITEIMNAVGYDAATVGNHEFDYTVPTLMKRAEELDCGYICCNFKSLETGELLFDPYKIIDFGDTQVAFVGVATPETLFYSTPTFFKNEKGEYIYSFGENGTELYDAVQENVDKARSEGADYVILLAHLGEHEVTSEWNSVAVAENTKGVDAVISGHSHEETNGLSVKNKDGEDVRIVQTGYNLSHIGKMTISNDGTISTELVDTVPAPDSSLEFPDDSWGKAPNREDRYVDTAVSNKIQEINASLDEQLSEVIGHTDFILTDSDMETGERRVRNGETNLGDFLTDAYRAYYDTDIAILNGGGIRASIPEGDITIGSLINVMPYSNTICAAKVTGQQILDVLEFASSDYPEESSYFLSTSGLEYTIDTSIPSTATKNEKGEFTGVTGEYRVKNVLINGEPLDIEKTYTVSSIRYLLEDGGDGFIISGKSEIYEDMNVVDIKVIEKYINNDLGALFPRNTEIL